MAGTASALLIGPLHREADIHGASRHFTPTHSSHNTSAINICSIYQSLGALLPALSPPLRQVTAAQRRANPSDSAPCGHGLQRLSLRHARDRISFCPLTRFGHTTRHQRMKSLGFLQFRYSLSLDLEVSPFPRTACPRALHIRRSRFSLGNSVAFHRRRHTEDPRGSHGSDYSD